MSAENAMPVAARERIWRVALSLLPGLALVLLRGVDGNWDLRNYHLYNPHAWLSGRMFTDIAPAQLQTWHNPLLDTPFYLLTVSGLDMRFASVWLTLPFAVALYLLLGLHASLSPERPSRCSQIVLVVLALGGAAFWSTLGNSMNDGFVAAAVLGGLGLVMRANPPGFRQWFWAGLLAGAMMGLKLSANFYCLAFAAAASLPRSGHRPLPALFSLAAGGLLGFLITYGWWGWTLYSLTGNPFFPYYNNVFHSPWVGPLDFADARFRVHGLGGLLLAPFQLLRSSLRFSELYLRDPRLLLGLLGLVWLALARGSDSRLRQLAAFFFCAYLLWALQYGIYRYALTLEVLAALVIVLCLQRLPGRFVFTALIAAAVLVNFATKRQNWGHVHNSSARLGIGAAPLPRDAMVIIAGGEPVAYLALGLPKATPLVAVNNNIFSQTQCSALFLRARATISTHAGSLWLLSPDNGHVFNDLMLLRLNEGLELRGECVDYPNSLGAARLCPLVRTTPVRPCH
jgi:hypothetical protein